MEVQNTLGFGFSEVICKDALETEFLAESLPFEREKELRVKYKDGVLAHRFYADLVCYDDIIIEIKSTDKGITDEYLAQTLNYMRAAGCPIGLIVNFGKKRLEYKRLVLK